MLRTSLGRGLLRLLGWRLETPPIRARRYVMVCAPHTSMWDAILMLVFTSAADLRVNWMVKAETMRTLGWLIGRLGAVPVHRDAPGGMVGQMVEAFARHEDFVLAIAPSATRRRTDGWRTGFHAIAREAGVPIVPAFLDYHHRRAGWSEAWEPSPDIDVDMERLRLLYADVRGKNPELQTPVRAARPRRPQA